MLLFAMFGEKQDALPLLCTLVLFVCATSLLDFSHFNGIEEEESPSERILNRIYFALTTLTTIGYGDISPRSTTSKLVAVAFQIAMLFAIGENVSKMYSLNNVNAAY